MRVIAGKYRHRILIWPDDAKHIRPTKDRIREAIFGALGDIEGKVVLDLYSGSGAMGIEALSRGASKSVFVDINQVALDTTKQNLKSLGISTFEATTLALEDVKAIEKLAKEQYKIDLIILDPPYKEGKYSDIIYLLKEKELLSDNGIIVIESDHQIELDTSEYQKVRDYKYGEIRVKILWRQLWE